MLYILKYINNLIASKLNYLKQKITSFTPFSKHFIYMKNIDKNLKYINVKYTIKHLSIYTILQYWEKIYACIDRQLSLSILIHKIVDIVC